MALRLSFISNKFRDERSDQSCDSSPFRPLPLKSFRSSLGLFVCRIKRCPHKELVYDKTGTYSLANEQLAAEGVHAQREAAPRRDSAVRGAEGKRGPKSF